jgi:hypothetical protein
MKKIARVALGMALLASSTVATVGTAFAAPGDDMVTVVSVRDGIKSDMAELPGVFAAAPDSNVLGVQVRRSTLPEPVFLDMLRVLGQRTDFNEDVR